MNTLPNFKIIINLYLSNNLFNKNKLFKVLKTQKYFSNFLNTPKSILKANFLSTYHCTEVKQLLIYKMKVKREKDLQLFHLNAPRYFLSEVKSNILSTSI